MLKPVKVDTIVKALAKIGFISIRQHGSHLVMKHPDGRITVVPMHKGEELGRGILGKLLKMHQCSKLSCPILTEIALHSPPDHGCLPKLELQEMKAQRARGRRSDDTQESKSQYLSRIVASDIDHERFVIIE